MLKFLRSKKGFTLVELMVVCIIVAILAAVAIPLMAANKKRAYETEAQAALGSIKTAMRVYYAEHGDYPTDKSLATIGIFDSDLAGTFFDVNNYSISDATTDTFTLTCDWLADGNAAKAADRKNSVKDYIGGTATTTLNEKGEWGSELVEPA